MGRGGVNDFADQGDEEHFEDAKEEVQEKGEEDEDVVQVEVVIVGVLEVGTEDGEDCGEGGC